MFRWQTQWQALMTLDTALKDWWQSRSTLGRRLAVNPTLDGRIIYARMTCCKEADNG